MSLGTNSTWFLLQVLPPKALFADRKLTSVSNYSTLAETAQMISHSRLVAVVPLLLERLAVPGLRT